MVNNFKDCVLQRAGHAGYVAERFSGLFARQSLVDVTLVCEEQKLRVHKLVLASNSVYFEEILQEDLGREPIIFLKDLNFEILKAMVEFMYCGETTIPQHLLPPLLAATKTFQVKELTSVINAMMTSNAASEDLKIIVNGETDSYRSMIATSCNETKYMHVKCSELEKEECDLLCGKSNSDMSPNDNQSLENNTSIDVTEHESEPTLYEESQSFETNKKEICTLLVTSDPVKIEEDQALIKPAQCKLKDVPNRCSESSTVSDDLYSTDDELKPMLYEQCCDFSDVDECDKTVSLSRSCLQQIEKDFAQYSFNSTDVPSKVGKCVKVYSHKRRKSADDVKNKIVDMNNVIPNPPSTDCIDLLDEPSTNDIPVTLLTSLDMESAEYIISLSTENIQSIVGATVSEQHTLIKCKDINHLINYNNQKENVSKKQLNSGSSDDPSYIKPILRRSLRLNQQESEEAVNNNESTGESVTGEKPFKKSNSPNRIEICGRGRRKAKDADRKVPEQSNNNNNQAHNSKRNCNNSRTHKNTTKLIVKKNNKSTFTTSGKEKDEPKVKANKMKCEIAEKVEANSTLFTQAKLNTIEHINRALWGDMSDISEECECTMDLQEYTPHAEIPFAVGLLPLRTALEKMQATPDYQPRKTRSSVAPIRYDASSLKRKSNSLDSAVISKKQNTSGGEPKQNASTVCHIRIRAAPSQYIRNRKKFISEDMTSLAAATIANRQ